MITQIRNQQKHPVYRALSALIAVIFTFGMVLPPSVSAQVVVINPMNLPTPGAVVLPTQAFFPAIIKGVTIYPDDPLQFDFIIDKGESALTGVAFEDESQKLIRYFMAALTVPEEELWVNLSPYEKDRIVPDTFGVTKMGRDLLAQDYLLKQLTASLMNPEDELGSEFWSRVYAKAQEKFGTTEIPMNTFNKIWIVPQSADVYEHSKGAFVVDSHLKVMLEEDYLALESNINSNAHGLGNVEKEDLNIVTGVSAAVIKEVLIPEIEKEVNQGETFANLRQIYNSVILATWYKNALKESILGQVYVDQNKTKGLEVEDRSINQKIYEQYVEAFEKGVFNYIREDYDPATKQIIPRKYFSGGANLASSSVTSVSPLGSRGVRFAADIVLDPENVNVRLDPIGPAASSPVEAVDSYNLVSRPDRDVTDLRTSTERFINIVSDLYGRVAGSGQMVTLTETASPELFELFLRGQEQNYKPVKGAAVKEASFSAGDIQGTRRIIGSDNIPANQKVFQLELQRGNEPAVVLTLKVNEDGAKAVRVIPKKTVLIYGIGTIASKNAVELLKLGYNIIAANRSANQRASLARDLGFPIVPLDSYGAAAYERAGFDIRNDDGRLITAIDYLEGLEGLPKIDLIVEGLDGKRDVVVDSNKIPVLSEDGTVITKLTLEVEEAFGDVSIAKVSNSLIYKREVFDQYNVPVLYQGSNNPDSVADGYVSETQSLELAGLTFDHFAGAKDLFCPSCNTTAQLAVLSPLLTDNTVKPESVSVDAFTIRRAGDPGSAKNAVRADGFGEVATNYHHADDALAFLKQKLEGVNLLEKLKPASVSGPGLGEFEFTTDATVGPQTKFHQGRVVIKAQKNDGTLLTAAEYKDMLRKNPRVALIQTDPKGGKFDATDAFDTLMNRIKEIHAFIVPAWVYQRSDGIGLIFLTPQESNVIPNGVTTALLRTGVIGTNDIAVANKEVNGSMELTRIKDMFEQYLPAAASSPVEAVDSYNLVSRPDRDVTDLRTSTERFINIVSDLYGRVAGSGQMVTLTETASPELFELFLRGQEQNYKPVKGAAVKEASFSAGDIQGTRRIIGSDNIPANQKVFQLELQRGNEPAVVLTLKVNEDGAKAVRVIPKKTVLIYGIGTIASKNAVELLKLGYNIIAANRSANQRASLARDLGFPIVPLDSYGAAAYERAGFDIRNDDGRLITAIDYLEGLEGLPKIDLIVEGLDGKRDVVVDSNKIPVLSEDGTVITKLTLEVEEAFGDVSIAKVSNSLIYKREVFDQYNVPVLYQGSNNPDSVADGYVSETQSLELAGLTFDHFAGAKDLFCPSCNTTAQLAVLSPLLTDNTVKPESVSVDAFTIRRAGDPGSAKNAVRADGFGEVATNYHHADDALAFLKQKLEGVNLLEKLKPASVSGPGLGEFEFTTDATVGPQTKFHQGRVVIKAQKNDGTLLTAAEYKDMLRKNPRVALIQTDPKGGKFDATDAFDTLMNRIKEIHAFIVPAWVYQRSDGIGLIFLTPQESNVIPNGVTTALLRTGVIGTNDIAVANKEVNGSMELTRIKDMFEQYLPADASSPVEGFEVESEPKRIHSVLKNYGLPIGSEIYWQNVIRKDPSSKTRVLSAIIFESRIGDNERILRLLDNNTSGITDPLNINLILEGEFNNKIAAWGEAFVEGFGLPIGKNKSNFIDKIPAWGEAFSKKLRLPLAKYKSDRWKAFYFHGSLLLVQWGLNIYDEIQSAAEAGKSEADIIAEFKNRGIYGDKINYHIRKATLRIQKMTNEAAQRKAASSSPVTKGGIDLNPNEINMKIKRDGNGVILPVSQQPFVNNNIEGFMPVIINVSPVYNLPMLLGLADTEDEQQASANPDLLDSVRNEYFDRLVGSEA